MRRAIVAALALAMPLAARAASLPPPPAGPPGVIRVWGNPGFAPALARWTHAFRRTHPNTRIEAHLTGSDVAFAALYSGRADIALVGREAQDETEAKAFQWVYGYPPTAVPVARGSLSDPGRSPALAVLVSRGNPIGQITFDELRKLFVANSDAAARHTWGELGATGAWASRPIHLYAPGAESGSGRFFRHAVLGDADNLAWPALHEFDTPVGRSPHDGRMWKRIAAAAAHDPDGLAISLAPTAGAPVKALAVSKEGPASALTQANVAEGRYPLARTAYAYVNRSPDGPGRADVAEFLSYVTGPAGQARLGSATGYLPLATRGREGRGSP